MTALDTMDLARAEERAETLRPADEAFAVCVCVDGAHELGDLMSAPWYASHDDAWLAWRTTPLAALYSIDGKPKPHVVRRPAWEVTA